MDEELAGRLIQALSGREEVRHRIRGRVLGERGLEPEGEWLTSREIMAWLKVGQNTVTYWRQSGRLKAERHSRRGGQQVTYWHLKQDVLAMLADETFQKHRARWQKANTPEAIAEWEKTRLLAALEMIARVHHRHRPDHPLEFQAVPGKEW